jgi:hypothetical protein
MTSCGNREHGETKIFRHGFHKSEPGYWDSASENNTKATQSKQFDSKFSGTIASGLLILAKKHHQIFTSESSKACVCCTRGINRTSQSLLAKNVSGFL